MIQVSIEKYLEGMLKRPTREELANLFPPVPASEIEEVCENARKQLHADLSTEYCQMVGIVDGGGYDVSFFRTRTTVVKVLGRTKTALGIVEQNLELRKQEMTGKDEVAYGRRDDCLILPAKSGQWIGRHIISRKVQMHFASFLDLLKKAYD